MEPHQGPMASIKKRAGIIRLEFSAIISETVQKVVSFLF